jgi:antitoxin (DNA-binding transcriptional repressor) of toxin-antitoxin stability system
MDARVEKCLIAPVAEVESRLDDFLQVVEAGESVVLTRDGSPVATLTPPEGAGIKAPGETAKKGLASLAGGWEGSDELADLVEEIRRTAHRS